jgi:hypothetical protein
MTEGLIEELSAEPGFNIRNKIWELSAQTRPQEGMHLASAIGMIVYTDRQDQETIRKPLNICFLIQISYPAPAGQEQSKKFLNKETTKIKNRSDGDKYWKQDFVDEKAINQALTTRKIDTYCFEAQSWGKSPLKGNEFAIMLKHFSSYTQQTIERNQEAMVDNIEYIARGIPYSKLEL